MHMVDCKCCNVYMCVRVHGPMCLCVGVVQFFVPCLYKVMLRICYEFEYTNTNTHPHPHKHKATRAHTNTMLAEELSSNHYCVAKSLAYSLVDLSDRCALCLSDSLSICLLICIYINRRLYV